MFGPGLDAKERQLEQQGRSLSIGLWSFVFTGRAEDDRQFADLYEDYIDKTAGEDWHCICFAKSVPSTGAGDKGWRADRQHHEASQQIRSLIRPTLIVPSASGILFFNPFTISNKGDGLFVPLNAARLSNEDYYKKRLDMVTEAVRASRHPSVEEVRTEYTIDERLRSLNNTLCRMRFVGIASAIFDKTIEPLLGRFFTLALS